jgi:hypothetical protein
MRPLIVLTGQGVARADGLNLTRRVKSLPGFTELFEQVPWRERQNLDELIATCGSVDASALPRLVQAIRAICLKERRATERKRSHRDMLAVVAAVAEHRPVLHLTTNIDGLTTTFAARDFGAAWPPYHGSATLTDVRRAIAHVLERGRGLAHLPLHGEAPLVASVSFDGEEALQTIYGDLTLMRGAGAWTPTLSSGLGRGAIDIEQHLPIAQLGYRLLEALLRGEAAFGRDGASAHALQPADLLVVGYGADERGNRASYPFERLVGVLAPIRDPGARWSALVFCAPEYTRTARWYARHGFEVRLYGDAGLSGAVKAEVNAAMVTAPPSLA